MNESSSLFNMKESKKNNTIKKLLFYSSSLINNSFPCIHTDKNLNIRNFVCSNLSSYWGKTYPTSSPGRKLSDLFWLTLPWERIKEELNEINVLDSGCGSGNYGERLSDWSLNRINRYTGLDVKKHDNWPVLKEKHPTFNFIECHISDIRQYIENGANLFISQSAIEHFEQDLLYFQHLRDYILSYKKSVIQIHLFPSAQGLRLYGCHGIRQYTPRSISKITRLFSNFSYAVLYNLGGKMCNDLHYEFITRPLMKNLGDYRNLKREEYDKGLFAAIEQDAREPSKKVSSFYALVVHSYYNKKIFLQE